MLLAILYFVLIPISLFTCIYWYYNHNFNYWIKRGIPGPRPLFFFGNLPMNLIKPFPLLELDFDRKYGKIYGLFCGNIPILTINDPALVKLILVKDFHLFSNRRPWKINHEILDHTVLYSRDNEWKRLRTLSTSFFTGSKIKKMIPIIEDCSIDLLQYLDQCLEKVNTFNLKQICGNYTMDVFARCAFATKINVYNDPNNPFLKNAKKIFHPNFLMIVAVFILPKFLLKYLNIKSIFNENSNQFIFNLSRKLLNDRKNNNQVYNDFLQLFIDTRKEENSRKTGLTDNEIIGQSWLFLLAGYETTSTAIIFCFYELALNSHIQQILYEELQTALNSSGRFDYEILFKLPFLDAVISETLRLYPPFLRIEREAKSDYQLGDTGIQIKRGQLINISMYAIHHNQEYFPEPECFNPNRFLPENKHQIIPFSYLPFALGPRNCMASRLALMELKICVAHVINKFILTTNPKTTVPPKYIKFTHLCDSKPLIITVNKR